MSDKMLGARADRLRDGGAWCLFQDLPSIRACIGDTPVTLWQSDHSLATAAQHAALFVGYELQFVADYRAALQSWMAAIRDHGYLIIVVSHAFLYERRLSLPSPWSGAQRRLYTSGILMGEIEEALAPNSYRVRHLGDCDEGYDYADESGREPEGLSDIVLILQKRPVPAWGLAAPPRPILADRPDYGFEPERTRLEAARPQSARKVLLLKLDHLGDFIMGLPALRRARQIFADAHLTLVVGSWNAQMAKDLALADRVVSFDVFPRNSSEEEVDVAGKGALLGAALPESYDLAVDLRTDGDTRTLLTKITARHRAGLGTRAQFPFLDTFLPIDLSRHEPEIARADRIAHDSFTWQPEIQKNEYRLICEADKVKASNALIWGPYWRLRPGNYVFEPHIELHGNRRGMLRIDIALEAQSAVSSILPGDSKPRLAFRVDRPNMNFEFRIWALSGKRPLDFSFYGGRLIRQAADSVLHQAEYAALLIDLIGMRMRTGVLEDLSLG